MTTVDLLVMLRRAGVVLSAKGDRLAFDAPAGVMTADLRAMLAERKAELMAILAGDFTAAAGALLVRAYLSGVIDADGYWDWDEWTTERAGICEFQGGASEQEAGLFAYELLDVELDGHALTVTVPAVTRDGQTLER